MVASLRVLVARVGGLFGRRQADRDLVDELNGHLDAHVEDNIRAGMARDEARRQAALRLGGVDMTTDAYREQRTLPWLEHVARDMRHAGRTLRRSPGFAAASALTLALAIGANVSIFTVVYRVLLKPLPYGDSSRLIALDYGVPRQNITSGINFMTWQLYYQLADRARTLDGVAAYNIGGVTLSGSGTPERLGAIYATPSLAHVLRVRPALGRWFGEEEGVTGAPQIAVLSYGLWARRFGLDPAIVGQSIRLSGVPTQVVGVMPADFVFPDTRTDLWLPAQSTRASASFLFTLMGVARLQRRSDHRSGARRNDPAHCGPGADVAEPERNGRGAGGASAGPRRAGRRDALDPARVGRPGAARRVRQRREPVPRPFRIEAARSRGASGARGEHAARSRATSWLKARCSRSPAAPRGSRWPGAPCSSWSRSVPPTCPGSTKSAWTAWCSGSRSS